MTAATRIEKLADLGTIGGGATAEKFNAELQRVLDNIKDPNTSAKAKRKIVLEFVAPRRAGRRLERAGVAR